VNHEQESWLVLHYPGTTDPSSPSFIPRPSSPLISLHFSPFTDFSLSESPVVSSGFCFPVWEFWQRVLPRAALHSASCGNKHRKHVGQPALRVDRRSRSFRLKPPVLFQVCKPGRRTRTMSGLCSFTRLSPDRRPEPCQFCRRYRSRPCECWRRYLRCSPRPTFLRRPDDRCLQEWEAPSD
jgi:hypothetical protein